MQTLKKRWAPIVLILSLLLSGCAMLQPQAAVSLEDVPAYSGAPYVEIDGNQPDFTEYSPRTIPAITLTRRSTCSAGAARRTPASPPT